MKIIISNLKIFLGLFMLILFTAVSPITVSAATEAVGDYQYNVSNGIATIAKYTGKESNVTVPTEVTINGMRYKISKIEASAFANNTTMTSLVIPKEITNIGRCAFKNCTSLSSITINGNIEDCETPPGWSSWEYYSVFINAGANTDSLTVTFSEGVTKVPAHLFRTPTSASCARVTKVILPETVIDIGDGAFYNCVELSNIKFGGTKTIGDEAFYHCSSMKELVLPSKLTIIGENAFTNCTGLEGISFPKEDCKINIAASKIVLHFLLLL